MLLHVIFPVSVWTLVIFLIGLIIRHSHHYVRTQNELIAERLYQAKTFYTFFGEEKPFIKCRDGFACDDNAIFNDVLSKLPVNINMQINDSLAITEP